MDTHMVECEDINYIIVGKSDMDSRRSVLTPYFAYRQSTLSLRSVGDYRNLCSVVIAPINIFGCEATLG